MNQKLLGILSVLVLCVMVLSTFGQPAARTDAIWARSTAGAVITLDGKLNEPAWAKADSIRILFRDNLKLIPGSGWFPEGGLGDRPTDSTDTWIKFLIVDNQLYMGLVAKDSSIGGSKDFNRKDGLLMQIKDRSVPNRPTPPAEYFYSWWYPQETGDLPAGRGPRFIGKWAPFDFAVPRDSTQIANWDAVTTVKGLANSDVGIDTSYTVEMRFNLTPMGYDATRSQGDIVEWNVSIYDADWMWPMDPARFSSNRTWWQCPWGNNPAFNVVRIHARPDVTVNSGTTPGILPEVIVRNGANFTTPTIDGKLDEPVWQAVPGFDIRYGDEALRNSYPSVGPYRSGQFQPALNGVTAVVLDPGDATIKWFFKGDMLYIGADVRDQAVWAIENFDQYDGVRFVINDRAARNNDRVLEMRDLLVRFDASGALIAEGYLATLLADTVLGAQAGLALKPGTTINNFSDEDAGFTVELAIDLTKIGYPAGRGDGVLFISATVLDGDSFQNPADNYGTRVWWFREQPGPGAPVWAYMDPNTFVVGVEERNEGVLPKSFVLLGNYPNPFNPSTNIRFGMPEAGAVTLKVFDLLGREVEILALGLREAGAQETSFNAAQLPSGVYLYRLEMTTTAARKLMSTQYGKMVLMK